MHFQWLSLKILARGFCSFKRFSKASLKFWEVYSQSPVKTMQSWNDKKKGGEINFHGKAAGKGKIWNRNVSKIYAE